MEQDKSQPKGIGGWMVLPMLGLAFSPLLMVFTLLRDILPIFTDGTFAAITTPGHPAYHPLWAPLLCLEVASNVILIVLALVTLVFIVRESRYAPKLAIAWFAGVALFQTADYFASDLIPIIAEQQDTESLKLMVRGIFAACLWIPYFLISKRVKATFVK